MFPSITAQFLLDGNISGFKYHLCKWGALMIPKNWEGCGLLDQCIFGKALLIKSLWQAMCGSGIWQKIFNHNYLKAHDLEHVYRDMNINFSNGSFTWRSFQKIGECWRIGMVWSFGNGHKIMIWSDPIMGVAFGNSLGEQTLSMIHRGCYFYLSQTIQRWEMGCSIWKSGGFTSGG